MAPTVPNITFAVSWVWPTKEVVDIVDCETALAICDNFPMPIGLLLPFDEADDLVLYDDVADDIDDSRSPLELPALAYAFAYGI